MPHLPIEKFHRGLAEAVFYGKDATWKGGRYYSWQMLDWYASKHNLLLIIGVSVQGTRRMVKTDGVLKDEHGRDHGIWISMNAQEDPLKVSRSYRRRCYPFTNVLFENAVQALLFQHGVEVGRAAMLDTKAMEKLTIQWITFRD